MNLTTIACKLYIPVYITIVLNSTHSCTIQKNFNGMVKLINLFVFLKFLNNK